MPNSPPSQKGDPVSPVCIKGRAQMYLKLHPGAGLKRSIMVKDIASRSFRLINKLHRFRWNAFITNRLTNFVMRHIKIWKCGGKIQNSILTGFSQIYTTSSHHFLQVFWFWLIWRNSITSGCTYLLLKSWFQQHWLKAIVEFPMPTWCTFFCQRSLIWDTLKIVLRRLLLSV